MKNEPIELLREIRRHNSRGLTKDMQGRIDAALSQQAEPPLAQDEREAFKRALHGQRVFRLNSDTINAAEWAWFARPAQTEQEPVAWLYKSRDGEAVHLSSTQWISPSWSEDWDERPLYTAPIAQTAPVPEQSGLPSFAEKILRKLSRIDDCFSDGQGADVDRHWFDMLSHLGLLSREQRSPALWSITQQGYDALESYRAALSTQGDKP